jgi:hypothetical protein
VEDTVLKFSQRKNNNFIVKGPINSSEVITNIRKLKPRTAPEGDGISNTLIRKLNPKAITRLTYLFNSILRLGYFPTRWKQAHVLAIPKPRKPPQDPGSYRPISLLSTLSKLLEKSVAKRLSRYAENNITRNEQFAFRKRHSTIAQLARLTDSITHGYNRNKHTGLVLLDIEKAYDTVWVKGLIYKLIYFNVPDYLVHFTQSYLTNRAFFVTVAGYRSPNKVISAGLPQGAVLSPLLFNLYTADIPRMSNIHLAMFADDTALYTQSWRTDTITHRLSTAITRLLTYFSRWRLKINLSKTEAILLTKRRPFMAWMIRLKNVDIPCSTSLTYLGLKLTKTLNYTSHIELTIAKALGMLVTLFPLLSKESSLSMTTKLHIYKTVIRPMLTYAAPIWCSMSTSSYRQMKVVQNKYMRVVANTSSGTPLDRLRSTLGMENIQSYSRRLAESFYKKCSEHPNPLVRSIGRYTLQELNTTYRRYKHERPKHCLL